MAGKQSDNGAAILKKLRGVGDVWKKQKQESKKNAGGTTLQEGVHICSLSLAKLVEGDKGAQLLLEFTCTEGESAGDKGQIWQRFTDAEAIIWTQRTLRQLGVEVDDLDLDDLPAACEDLMNRAPSVRIRVKEKDGYLNCYLNKMLEADTSDGSGGNAPEPEPAAPAPTRRGRAAEPEPEPEDADAPEPGEDVTYKVNGKRRTGVFRRGLICLNEQSGKAETADKGTIEKLVATDD